MPSTYGASGWRPIKRRLDSIDVERSLPMNDARATAIEMEMSSRPSGVGPSHGACSATASHRSISSCADPRSPALMASIAGERCRDMSPGRGRAHRGAPGACRSGRPTSAGASLARRPGSPDRADPRGGHVARPARGDHAPRASQRRARGARGCRSGDSFARSAFSSWPNSRWWRNQVPSSSSAVRKRLLR